MVRVYIVPSTNLKAKMGTRTPCSAPKCGLAFCLILTDDTSNVRYVDSIALQSLVTFVETEGVYRHCACALLPKFVLETEVFCFSQLFLPNKRLSLQPHSGTTNECRGSLALVFVANVLNESKVCQVFVA